MAHGKKIHLKVASPCKERWDDMVGDDAVRFCGKCEKNVYQLSNMSSEAIENLLGAAGSERICGRFYQRKDGTVLTADCPVGATQRRRKTAALGIGAGIASAVSVALWPAGAHKCQTPPEPSISTDIQPLMGAMEVIDEPQVPIGVVYEQPDEPEMIQGEIAPQEYEEVMGDVAYDPEAE